MLRQRHLFPHNYRRCLHLASAYFLRLSRAKASRVIPSHARRRRPEQGKPGANPARSRHCDATAKLPPSQNTCQEACMRKRRLSANTPSIEALLRSKATPPDRYLRQTFAVCLLREREPNPARLRAKTLAQKAIALLMALVLCMGLTPPTQLGRKKRGRQVAPARRRPSSSLPLPSPS